MDWNFYHFICIEIFCNTDMAKKNNRVDSDGEKNLQDKLEKLIEQSRNENEALKKLLKGLEDIHYHRKNKNNK